MTATTHSQPTSVSEATLFLAFDLSQRSWTLAMTTGLNTDAWVRTMVPGDWAALKHLLEKARRRFGLPATVRVVSCYEAGRDGFWVHRGLEAQGVANRVVDSASIEVNRRARRNKTDRLDARKLVALLVRVWLGERRAWREVRVPTVADEAARQVSRDRSTLVTERTRLINQLRSWTISWGAHMPSDRPAQWWTGVRDWTGAALPVEVQARLERATVRLALIAEQLAEIEAQQVASVTTAPADSPGGRLRQVKSLGATTILTLLEEGLVWRQFRNRRQVGGMLGFAPTHFESGELHRDQGIHRAGNRRWQNTMVQLAWRWIRWQPDTALSQWYRARFAGTARSRRIGIVAVARRLLIALWRYATSGVLPKGTILVAR